MHELVQMEYERIMEKQYGCTDDYIDVFGMKYYWWLFEIEVDLVIRNRGTWSQRKDVDWEWDQNLSIHEAHAFVDEGREIEAIFTQDNQADKLLNT